MADPIGDEGTIQTLLDRLNRYRLPRALKIKEKVDQGELLQDSDIEFLKRVLADASSIGALVERNADYQALVAKVIGLYDEITRKALDNEEKSGGGARP